jgi:hypothetical protein
MRHITIKRARTSHYRKMRLCTVLFNDLVPLSLFRFWLDLHHQYVRIRFSERTGELLSNLRATVNSKCPALKGHPAFSNLEGSNLIATVGSHDNPVRQSAVATSMWL